MLAPLRLAILRSCLDVRRASHRSANAESSGGLSEGGHDCLGRWAVELCGAVMLLLATG